MVRSIIDVARLARVQRASHASGNVHHIGHFPKSLGHGRSHHFLGKLVFKLRARVKAAR